jgi:hypothetical protein
LELESSKTYGKLVNHICLTNYANLFFCNHLDCSNILDRHIILNPKNIQQKKY